MRKLTTFLFSALLFGSINSSAQTDDEYVDMPPRVAYHVDFEDMEQTNGYVSEEINIGGKRWKLHRGRIVNSTIQGVPQGTKAAELLAGKTDGQPAMLELLDPVIGNTISLAFTHSGMDRVISRSSSAWQLQATFDGGQTWAEMELSFDSKDYPSLFSAWVPANDNAEYRFRIIYTGGEGTGKDWRLLIDDIMVTQGNGFNIPWYVQPGRLAEGFQTAENSISFAPILNGTTWFFGAEDFEWATTYLEMTIDDREPQRYYTMPLDIIFEANDLNEGEHHMNIRFMNRDGNKLFDDALQTNMNFTVCPITPISGITNLRKAEIGKFYELTPDGNDSIFINWYENTRAQKWLYDGKSGILVDDPNYLDYTQSLVETQTIVKSMRGRLLEIDNNLIFRLDRKPEVETIATDEFRFLNKMLNNVSLINDGSLDSQPLALTGVKLTKPVGMIDGDPNGNIEIIDQYGNTLMLKNIYPHNFKKSTLAELPTDKPMIVFGMPGKTFIEGTQCFFPLAAIADTETNINTLKQTDKQSFTIEKNDGNIKINLQGEARIDILSTNGAIVASFPMNNKSANLYLANGTYIAKATFKNGKTETIKFQK